MTFDFKACMEIIRDFANITSMLLSEQTEEVYQEVLNKAIKLIPGAQAGSILINENGRFKYVAAVGYDLELLKKVTFTVEEEEVWLSKGRGLPIIVRSDVLEVDESVIKDERRQILRKAGGIVGIKSVLIIPVRFEGELKLILNLDNFEREDAFDENSIIIATALANMLGTVFKRIELERQLKEKNALLEYTAYHDVLTGLPNRRLFEELSEKLLAIAKRDKKFLSVLFLDLDKFKPINDTYGHQVGDEVLKVIAGRLERCARSNDTVSRFGGDEFVVLAYDCPRQGAVALVERLIKTIEEPIQIGELTLQLSASVGIATFPEDGNELSELIRLADERLYIAKKTGSKIVTHG